MKKLLIICSSIVLLLNITHAQQVNSAVQDSVINHNLKKARLYLQGATYPYDPAKAFQLNMQCAQAGSAQGMNAVAIQYQNGLGVDSNNAEAGKWFKKAAEAGYNTAWCNLGIYYKSKPTPDFKQSYECFVKAVATGVTAAYYWQGYMLYKGLGCRQNYKKAVELFKKDAYTGNAASMHYYGLALRNGYGVAANVDSARYWLAKAASLGYTYSDDELQALTPEVAGEAADIPQRLQAARRKVTPGTNDDLQNYRQVSHVTATMQNITGIWQGYILKYDWSGQHVISTGKLALQLACTDSVLTGIWLEDDSLQVAVNGRLRKQGIVFSNMHYKRASHYTRGIAKDISFEQASLRLVQKGDTLYLAGNLQLHRTQSNEPERPMYIALTRGEQQKENAGEANKKITTTLPEGMTMQVYPNPFAGELYVQLTLPQTTNVQLQVSNAQGQVIYTGTKQTLQAGVHKLPLAVNAPGGAYVLTLRYAKSITSTIIVKQ